MSRPDEQQSHQQQEVLSDTYHNFIIRIPNPQTRENYVCRLRKFLNYCQVDNYDQLLYNGDTKLIHSMTHSRRKILMDHVDEKSG